MDFHPIFLQDKAWIEQLLSYANYNSCEYSFSSIFNWSGVHRTEIARVGDYGVLRTAFKGYSYLYPFGRGDVAPVIEQMIQDAAAHGSPLLLSLVLEPMKQELEMLFPDRFVFREEREYFDYIYTFESLATLKGRNLSGKRNHVNIFQRTYPNWSFEQITAQTLPECWQMNQEWEQENGGNTDAGLTQEQRALRSAFDNFFEEGLVGGLVRVDGKVIAYTMGRPLNSDTFVVHFEKALSGYNGAYQMINQQFVQHCCQGYSYINREDDAGVEGLRRAKLSYRPQMLVKKYEVCLKENA